MELKLKKLYSQFFSKKNYYISGGNLQSSGIKFFFLFQEMELSYVAPSKNTFEFFFLKLLPEQIHFQNCSFKK